MKKDIMRRATAILLGAVLSASFVLTSCESMLDVESDRQAFEPDLNSKTDSVFYAFGIAQAMQKLADQYFYQGEMRGELVATTEYTDSSLTQLKDFSAGLTNKYDSAYVYYNVINNCNYYLAHRNLNLYTGSTQVTISEYAAVLAFRAWAYLQLCRNYGSVPFFTVPLTTISQIDDNTFPYYDIRQVTDALAPELSQYTKVDVPDYGNGYSIGTLNGGGTKSINTKKIFVPAGVVLGDLYLESAQSEADYEKAANSYVDYLIATKTVAPNIEAKFQKRSEEYADRTNPVNLSSTTPYTNIYSATATPADALTYIPMAVSRVNGIITNVPYSFGYDYYALSNNAKWMEEIQLIESDVYKELCDTLTYYYRYSSSATDKGFKFDQYGDMRTLSITRTKEGTTTLEETTEDINWVNKFQSGNIIVYRITTVYLHLCEALNRMGMPDLAFGLLKEGIRPTLYNATWLTQKSKDFLALTFCNKTTTAFDDFNNNSYPIHQHGAGATSDDSGGYGDSPYQFASEITAKFNQIQAPEYGALYPGLASRISSGATTQADTIMAMEEMLCDEEAMEFCFEGTRWYDLMRFARHKNAAGLPGNLWLADKVKSNKPKKDLTNELNWYLPFK